MNREVFSPRCFQVAVRAFLYFNKSSELFNVLYEYNAVEVEGAFSCKQLFTGKGAGSHPTGSAVLSYDRSPAS